ncbi:hypothetical protein EG328_007573 [Venturia inaequalis]|uniref:Uncharacterized protein n=1 Tax=Venturia inaequalis TaxID=5025 RepID=A0A8H3VCB1_VENIN|nr:hypothetical protein EG328_007573 [Venturia inaequalis]
MAARELRQDILLRTFTDHHPAEFIAKIRNYYDNSGLTLCQKYGNRYGDSMYDYGIYLTHSSCGKAITTRTMILKTAAVFDEDDTEYAEAMWTARLEMADVRAREMYGTLGILEVSNPVEYERG